MGRRLPETIRAQLIEEIAGDICGRVGPARDPKLVAAILGSLFGPDRHDGLGKPAAAALMAASVAFAAAIEATGTKALHDWVARYIDRQSPDRLEASEELWTRAVNRLRARRWSAKSNAPREIAVRSPATVRLGSKHRKMLDDLLGNHGEKTSARRLVERLIEAEHRELHRRRAHSEAVAAQPPAQASLL